MFKNQTKPMQTDQKFSASYCDDWDKMLEPPTSNEPAPLEPKPIGLPTASTLAKAEAGSDLAQAPKLAGGQGAVQKGSAGPAPTTAPAAKVAIPMPEKLGRYPGLLARSAIFRIGRAGEELARSEIACYGEGYGVIYEGPRLGMRDKSVWERALRAAKQEGFLGVEFSLPTTLIAAAIGGGDSGPALARIGDSLLRLSRASVEYRLPGGATGTAALLRSARKTAAGWLVSFDPGLATLLSDDKQFEIDAVRKKLLSSDLARWMHDFMSTHKSGYAGGFKLGDLSSLCGWRGAAGQFPTKLSEALAELGKQCPELVAGFEIQRGRRSSATWRARVDKGPEAERFDVPAKKSRPANPGRPRRGGVSL